MTQASPGTAGAAGPGVDPFGHEGLFYADAAEYLAGTVPFVRNALAADEPVLVAAPRANLELIGSALGGATDGVRFVDMTEAGRNPGRIIPEVLHAFAEQHAGRRVSVIGEPIWPGRSPAEYRAAVQHESLINLAFAGRAATILCPYDAAGLDAAALADAARTHPVLLDHGIRRPSGGYLDPASLLASFGGPPPEAPDGTHMLLFDADLRPVRDFVRLNAATAGLPVAGIVDLLVAVNEVATNTVSHTASGAGTVRLWREGGEVVCEIRDSGHIGHPLAGRLPPDPDSQHGRGLLIVNHLCDLVEIWSAETGTVVRMHVRP